MNKHLALVSLIFAITTLSGCGTGPYAAPAAGEPYALVKLKYSYSSIVNGTNLGARMTIRHGEVKEKGKFKVGHNKSIGKVKKGQVKPRIAMESVKIHVGQPTDVRMAVYFYWYTTQTYTTYVNNMPQVRTRQVYNERNCTVEMNFKPKSGKVYLLDYSSPNVSKGCLAKAYEQRKISGGKFKLRPVGTSKRI